MNQNLDEITKQMKPNKQFIDEYLELLIGKKSEFKYNVFWHYIDDDQGFIKCPLNKDIFYVDKDFYLAEDGCHYDIAGGKKDMLVIDY